MLSVFLFFIYFMVGVGSFKVIYGNIVFWLMILIKEEGCFKNIKFDVILGFKKKKKLN